MKNEKIECADSIKELQTKIELLEAENKKLKVPYTEVTDKLYWLELGITKLAFTDYDELVNELIARHKEGVEGDIVLFEISRTEEQMRAKDMRALLSEMLAAGIKLDHEKQQSELVKKLLETKLDVSAIINITGVTEEKIKEIKKSLQEAHEDE